MPKLSLKHKVILSFTGIMWAIWIIYSIVMHNTIISNDKVQSLFGILSSLMIIINLGLMAVVMYPDISYTDKKINDGNRDMIYYYRRTAYCYLTMLFTFFLGGMSISIYYENWRIGFSVVVPVFLISFAAVMAEYIVEILRCFKKSPSEGADKDTREK